MKQENENKFWSWVIRNFPIRDEENQGRIIADAYSIFEGIPKEERKKDLLPHATMTACLVVASLNFSKHYSGTDLRFACRQLIIEPQSILGRFTMPINYIPRKGELTREKDDIWLDPSMGFDLDEELIGIPPQELDAEVNLSKCVLHFASKIFLRGISVPRPAPSNDISAQYLELADNDYLNHKVRFIALCLAAAFSHQDYLLYRKRAGEILTRINADLNHHNPAVNYYSKALSVPHPTEVV